MSYFITKYALSSGIKEYSDNEVKEHPESVGMITMVDRDLWHMHFHGEGRDWHRTKEAAIARAEDMRKAKIASLKKSIAKMEKLDFTKEKA